MWLNIRIEKNFKLKEFACKCCQKVYLHSDLVDKLQRIRDHYGRPLIIVSGYRCPRHNRRVGGARRSYHLRGKAADIKIPGLPLESLAHFCALVGFKGVKAYYYRGFVHVDLRWWRWHRF